MPSRADLCREVRSVRRVTAAGRPIRLLGLMKTSMSSALDSRRWKNGSASWRVIGLLPTDVRITPHNRAILAERESEVRRAGAAVSPAGGLAERMCGARSPTVPLGGAALPVPAGRQEQLRSPGAAAGRQQRRQRLEPGRPARPARRCGVADAVPVPSARDCLPPAAPMPAPGVPGKVDPPGPAPSEPAIGVTPRRRAAPSPRIPCRDVPHRRAGRRHLPMRAFNLIDLRTEEVAVEGDEIDREICIERPGIHDDSADLTSQGGALSWRLGSCRGQKAGRHELELSIARLSRPIRLCE